MIPSVSQYAGQQLLTGPQAKAYADNFIAVHLSEMPYGGLYSKISTASLAKPKDPQLQALVETSFRGTTLRGLLLEAYAFAKIGQIMLWGAIAAFIAAALMAALVGLGFRHARRTERETQMFPAREAVPALLTVQLPSRRPIHNLPTPANRRGQWPLSQLACCQRRPAKADTSARRTLLLGDDASGARLGC